MNAGAALAQGEVLLFFTPTRAFRRDADAAHPAGLADSAGRGGASTCASKAQRLPARDRAFHEPALARDRDRHRRSGHLRPARSFERTGGFPPLELMEDIALSRSLKRVSRRCVSRTRRVTSGRRWERRGVLRTVLLMACCALAFFFGAATGESCALL